MAMQKLRLFLSDDTVPVLFHMILLKWICYNLSDLMQKLCDIFFCQHMLFKMGLFQEGAVYDLMFKRKGDYLNVSDLIPSEEDGPDPILPEPPTKRG